MNYDTPEIRAKHLIVDNNIQFPSELNLEEIANSEYLIVEEEDLTGHLGRINFSADFGLIKIDSKIKENGQKRFTLAHELGHYFNERLLRALSIYKCTALDIHSFKSVKVFENRANEFASELLMHKPWFSEYIRNREINFELIKDIAQHFEVSLTAAAIRYANIGKYPLCVIMSEKGKVNWSYISDYFPFKWIPKGYELKKESAAYDFFVGKGVQTCADLMPSYTWFADDNNSRKDVYLYEQNVAMRNYNSVLTLLWKSKFN